MFHTSKDYIIAIKYFPTLYITYQSSPNHNTLILLLYRYTYCVLCLI